MGFIAQMQQGLQRLSNATVAVTKPVYSAAESTGIISGASKVAQIYADLSPLAGGMVDASGGAIMMRLGYAGIKKSNDEGPDLQFAKSVLGELSGLEIKLRLLKSAHTEFDTAKSIYDKISGSPRDTSPKPAVAEKKKLNALAKFEKRLARFEDALSKATKNLKTANASRTTSLEFPVGTSNLDIFGYWGETKDSLESWFQLAKNDFVDEYANTSFDTPLTTVSSEDGGRGHVVKSAMGRFRSKHVVSERQASIHGSCTRAGVRVLSYGGMAAGGYLVARGVFGLGRDVGLLRASVDFAKRMAVG